MELMKILLIGEIYSNNLGDPLLCESVEKRILEMYPNAEIVKFDMSGKINYQDRYGSCDGFLNVLGKADKLKLYYRLLNNKVLRDSCEKAPQRYISMWRSLCGTLRKHNFDVAVFAGGGVLMDYFSGIIYLIVKRLSLAHIKIIFHACGMGPMNSADEYLLRKAFLEKNILSISLRDNLTLFRERFPTHAKVFETYDTALGCSLYYAPAEKKTARYGVGLIYKKEFFDEQVNLIRQLIQSKADWKAFTNGAVADMAAAKKILREAGMTESEIEEHLVNRPTTPEELVETVTQFNGILSFRLHSQIVAASFGIPCYGFVWDSKVSEFFSKLGFSENQNSRIPPLQEILPKLQSGGDLMRKSALEQAELSKCHLYEGIQAAMGGV